MSWEAWLTLAVVLCAVVFMVRDMVAPVVAIVSANVLLLVSGVIDAEAAFTGFSNPAPITVAALFIVARAVEKTGALQPLVQLALGNGESGRLRLARLLVPTAGASAFLNNTPVVAMLAPQVADWAEKRGQAASLYLMPISYVAVLGGVITLIGTSTNLVVAGLMLEAGLEPLGMFELTKVGLPVAITGVVLLILTAPWLLPNRRPVRRQFEEEIREYVVHQRVTAGGPLDGRTVETAGLRHLQGVFLAEIEREGQTIAPAAPTTVLRGGDRLAFVGRVDIVRDLQTMRGLVSEEEKHAASFNGSDHTFFEVVVSGASPLTGKSLKENGFRGRYQAAVVAIHRAGERVRSKLGEVKLREGDTLLVVADSGFADRWRDRSDFLLVSHLGGSPPASTRQASYALAVTFAVVVVAGLGIIPILHAALLGAIALVLGRVLTPAEARSAIDLDTLLVIAASFGLGAAIESSGLAALLGQAIVEIASGWGAWGVLLAVTLAAMVLTEALSNNAAAVLIFPIALASAQAIGADPRPFVIALTIAASCSFLTPIGYQTNTMVYGMGGYRFADFTRLGAPLTLMVLVTILVFVPLFWPF